MRKVDEFLAVCNTYYFAGLAVIFDNPYIIRITKRIVIELVYKTCTGLRDNSVYIGPFFLCCCDKA